MNSTELLDLFRSEMADTEEPYLWSDSDVYGYIDDAQKMFCRLTDGLDDATTPEVVDLAVGEGDDWLATHKSILKFRSAYREDTGRPVEIVNYEDLPARGWRLDSTQGPVKALITGMEKHKVRVYPVSNEEVTVKLLVFRLPLESITDEGEQSFEIDEQHHRHLLLWVKHLAYSKQDAETFDKTKAAEFEGKFVVYCGGAKNEQGRAAHKTRVVAYGGI